MPDTKPVEGGQLRVREGKPEQEKEEKIG